MKKLLYEMFGTFVLVFLGCGSAVIGGASVGYVGISLAFGIAIICMAYSIGPHTGCHVNPAVSFAFWLDRRISGKDFFKYVTGQFLGGFLAAFALFVIMKGKLGGFDPVVSGLGQNGWGAGYLGEFAWHSAAMFETMASFVFIYVIMKVTKNNETSSLNGLVIGLTLAAIHLVGIHISGVSVNPARSFGPAVFTGAKALSQLWLFFIFPMVGGALAYLASKESKAAKKPHSVLETKEAA